MPYMIVDGEGEYCVHKQNEDESAGEKLKCYPSRSEAEDYIKALYANVEDASKASLPYAVKAVEGEEWELDVLGVPYGGPMNGKDSDGEFFSPKTQLHPDRFKRPLITYYHGWDPQGNLQGDPEVIGEVKSFEKRDDGVWYRVVLNKVSQYAKRIKDAAKKGYAFASTGSISHLVRKNKSGEITNWPVVELALVDAREGRKPRNHFAVALPAAQKAYQLAGIELPELPEANESETEPSAEIGGEVELKSAPDTKLRKPYKANGGTLEMDENDIKKVVDQLVADALKTESDARVAAEAAAKAEQERIDAAVKAEREKWEAEAAKANRLPGGSNATPLKFADTDKYDNLTPGEHAYMIEVYEALRQQRPSAPPISDSAIKAFALKIESEAAKGDKNSSFAVKAMRAVVPEAVKAYEINYSTYSGYGSQWVGTLYHTDLWEKIRGDTWVVAELESKGDVREVPAGYSSDTVPLESTDPRWYNIAEAVAHDSTSGRPVATITSSNIATGNKNVTLGKMGCRVIFTGELVEDSLIAWVPNAYRQIQKSGAEQMEYAMIDGDTTTTQYLNINDQGGTPTAGDLFLMTDGFRHLPLVTTTTNKRDGGALDVSDFLETVKLMGNAGQSGADPTKVTFIIDPNTYWKCLELDEVKTKDVFSMPTIEKGQLVGLWGYPLKRSYFMHYAGIALGSVTTATYMNKACTTGFVDQTTEANNTKGAILAVRWDQWALRWKRRMSLEVDRWPEADANQIVAIMRWGMSYRDGEASALTYNLTV